jgi:DNA-binding SARP family transcriptional activator
MVVDQGAPARLGPEKISQVHIQLLGSFHLTKAGRSVSTRGGGKTETFLARLALHPGRLVPRDVLLDMLWPDADAAAAGQSLNTLVYSLHKLLGDALGGATPVLHAEGAYRLNLEAGVSVDVWYLERLGEAGDTCARAGDREGCIALYERGIQLYRGDLCISQDLQAIVERERLRNLYLSMLARLADYAFEDHEYSRSLGHALRLLSCEPIREDAHRLAMRCYVRRGERAQAMRQFRLCSEMLRREFDANPEPATTALFEHVRNDPTAI